MSWGGSIPLRTRSCRRYTGCGCRRRVRGAGRRADGRSGNPDRPSSTRLRQGDELLEEVPGAVGVGPVRHVGGVAGHVAGNRRAGEHELAAQGDEVRAAGVAVAGAAEVAALVHRKADPGWVEGVEVERSLHPNSHPSLLGTPRWRENCAGGCPPTPVLFLVVEAVEAAWCWDPTLKGHALLPLSTPNRFAVPYRGPRAAHHPVCALGKERWCRSWVFPTRSRTSS